MKILITLLMLLLVQPIFSNEIKSDVEKSDSIEQDININKPKSEPDTKNDKTEIDAGLNIQEISNQSNNQNRNSEITKEQKFCKTLPKSQECVVTIHAYYPSISSPSVLPSCGRMMSSGSGFFISGNYVVTNSHVLVQIGRLSNIMPSKIEIITNNNKSYEAKLVGFDPSLDIAVLKIESNKEFSYLSFRTTPINVGEKVFVISSPLGLDQTVTDGIISNIDRNCPIVPYSCYQTTALMTFGSSGAPIIDGNFNVIGMCIAGIGPSGNIGFIIPGNIIQYVSEQIIQNNNFVRPYIGLLISDIEESDYPEFDKGIIVLESSGPSKNILFPGDIIIGINNRPIEKKSALFAELITLKPGTKILLNIKRFSKDNKLEDMSKEIVAEKHKEFQFYSYAGLIFNEIETQNGNEVFIQAISPETQEYQGLQIIADLLSTQKPTSIKVSYVNGKKISSCKELITVLKSSKREFVFMIIEQDKTPFLIKLKTNPHTKKS